VNLIFGIKISIKFKKVYKKKTSALGRKVYAVPPKFFLKLHNGKKLPAQLTTISACCSRM